MSRPPRSLDPFYVALPTGGSYKGVCPQHGFSSFAPKCGTLTYFLVPDQTGTLLSLSIQNTCKHLHFYLYSYGTCVLTLHVIVSRQPDRSAPCSRFSSFSPVTKSPVVHPLSVQPLTKCLSSNPFVLKTIHFDGGVYGALSAASELIPIPSFDFQLSTFNSRPSHQSLVASHQSPTVVSSHSVNILLNEVECRVLGSLIEKEITTPEYYPLSLNALVNACNQKSNRDPVMNLDEAAVRQALHSLDGQSLVRYVSASDSRVTKYEHRLQEAFNFYRHEIAILCVLLLRGPQTPGELRTRAERMHPFDDLGAVQSSLQHLMKREPPLVKVLPRQPGTKEARYAHLLSGDVEEWDAKSVAEPSLTPASVDGERIAHLEREVAALRNDVADFQKEVAELKQKFADFKKQFD